MAKNEPKKEPEKIEKIDPQALKARVSEVERVLSAVLTGIQDAEKELGINIMPKGTYYGVNFDD